MTRFKKLLLAFTATLGILFSSASLANGFDAILGARLLNGAPEPYFVVRYNYLIKPISVNGLYYVWVRPEFRLDADMSESYIGGEAVLEFQPFGIALDYKFDGGSELTVELRTRF